MKTLYYNGNIHTIEEAHPVANAMVVDENKFSFVGDEADARTKIDSETAEVDLGGRLVIPAFNDSHLHFIYTSKKLSRVDLGGSDSVGEIVSRMGKGLESHSGGAANWLIGEGWNQDYFSDKKRFPTRFDLDEISSEIPILITRVCAHIGVVNSAALRKIGLDRDTAIQHGDLVGLLPDGEPDGVVKEKFLISMIANISDMDKDELKELILVGQKKLHEKGIVSIQSDDVPYVNDSDYNLLLSTFRELEDEGLLQMRLGEQVNLGTVPAMEKFFSEGYGYGWGTEKVRVTSTKHMLDGSLGARTAALRQPYADAPQTSGLLSVLPEDLNELVRISNAHGCPVAVHAIGDRAIELILDSIENVREGGDQSIRHGIVHCQITDTPMLERIQGLKAITLIQPIFIDYDMNMAESRVGPELVATSYAWKTMMDMGIHASFGTDSPVEPFDPMRNIYCAVTQQNITGEGKRVFLPAQKVSMDEAVRAYTFESAYASGEEGIKGTIAAGKLADFVVLDHDLFDLESYEDILDTKVLATVFDGKAVYDPNSIL
ncbi:MAG: amidohydrolase [Clostridiales Family XIII bacterium]|nr:amidohydrolase [Clostridiales Family XIII bacterium]